MRANRFILATLAGGFTVFVTGLGMFTWPPLQTFYRYAMTAGEATNVPRDAPLLWAVLVGALAYAALVTLVIGSRAPSIATGARTGAAVGFLLWSSANFMLYGISHVGSLTSAVVDPLVELVPGAVAGAVIAAALRRGEAAGRSPAVAH